MTHLARRMLTAGLFLFMALLGPGSPFLRPSAAQEAPAPAAAPDSLEAPESTSAHGGAAAIKRDAEGAPTGGPYGRGPGWVPGQPLPQKAKVESPPSPAGQGEGGEEAKEQKGRDGLILYDQLRDVDPGGQGDEVQTEVPSQYIVQKGDTLWSICQRFFQNPYYWPKLWSFNDAITNPHWIYPGDLIATHAPGKRPLSPAARQAQDVLPRMSRNSATLPNGLFLHQNGFVEPNELDSAGTIAGSREEKIMLASLDEIYIDMNKKKPLRVKDRYTIYKTIKTVRRPTGDKAVLGEVVEILGDVEIKQITSGGIARAVILEAFGAIERGFRVGPLRRTYKLVDPRVNRFSLDAVVVAALQPSVMLDTQQLAFVDLGRQSGIQVGNRLYAIRRGDAYPGLLAKTTSTAEDRRYPKEIVAEITIVDVRDKTAAGLITRSLREIRVGDKVEARKGY